MARRGETRTLGEIWKSTEKEQQQIHSEKGWANSRGLWATVTCHFIPRG